MRSTATPPAPSSTAFYGQFHGSLYEFFRNDKLNANNLPGNAAGTPRGVMRWNQPGFVVDGPVRIPKVYNGKNKTFFMVSTEWIRNASPLPYTASFPTAAERRGDFSSLTTSSGAPVIIYDPSTTTLTNGQYLRQPFPGNVIPKRQINPIGLAIINEYPMPNLPGTAGGFNNYVVGPNSQQDKYHSIASRVDRQINDKNRLTMMGFSNQRHQLFRPLDSRTLPPAPATCTIATTTAAVLTGRTPFAPIQCLM